MGEACQRINDSECVKRHVSFLGSKICSHACHAWVVQRAGRTSWGLVSIVFVGARCWVCLWAGRAPIYLSLAPPAAQLHVDVVHGKAYETGMPSRYVS